MKLLLRLYEPTGGRVTVDGVDVRDLTFGDLRGAIGLVSQDVFLFDGTVRENIAYGDPDAPDEAIEEAARLAEAHDFITALPNGYDTLVGERGQKLSGGQRQRCERVLQASGFGVPQLRPRAILVALRPAAAERFQWPEERLTPPPTVTSTLGVAKGGWEGASDWAVCASGIAPTLVGGSKKHGGPDLGPTQAKRKWQELRVNAHLVSESPPPQARGMPCLTIRMAAIQRDSLWTGRSLAARRTPTGRWATRSRRPSPRRSAAPSLLLLPRVIGPRRRASRPSLVRRSQPAS